MPRQRTNYSLKTYHVPDDFPQRIRLLKADGGQSGSAHTGLLVGAARPARWEGDPAMRRSAHAPRVRLNPVAVGELLDLLGILQNELARWCGFSRATFPMLMNGERSLSPRAQRRLM